MLIKNIKVYVYNIIKYGNQRTINKYDKRMGKIR